MSPNLADVIRAERENGRQDRLTRIYRVAELVLAYRAQQVGGKWRVRNLENGELIDAEYPDEAAAKVGARMATAVDIDALYD